MHSCLLKISPDGRKPEGYHFMRAENQGALAFKVSVPDAKGKFYVK